MNLEKIKILCPMIEMKLNLQSFTKIQNSVENGYLWGDEKNKINNLLIRNVADWEQTRYILPSEQWHFHTLGRSLGGLLNYKFFSYKTLELAKKNVLLWIEWDRLKSNYDDLEQVWGNHTVALRLDFFLALYLLQEDNDWLKPIITKHIEFLLDDKNYDGNWNHGLDQNISLITAAYIFHKKEVLELAYQRIKENFHVAFDEEGVTNEQSITYQHYNIHRYSHVEKILNEIELDNSFITSKLDLGYEFLLYSLLPNGHYAPLGDSLYTMPLFSELTPEINFLLTKGKKGFEPKLPLEKVYKSGYIFGKSSWKENDNPSCYSIRFGKERIIHGHNDHMSLTFFGNQKMIISDGGFHGYTDDFFRHYFRSPYAHNVVISENPKDKFLWNETTELVKHSLTNSSSYYLLSDKPHINTFRKRAVLMKVKKDFFIVVDEIESSIYKKYSQYWHFFSDFDVSFESDFALIITDGIDQYRLHNSQINSTMEILSGYVKIENGKYVAASGFIGLGHNDLQRSNTLKTSKEGNKCSFVSIFSKYEDNIEILQNDFSLIRVNDETVYSIKDLFIVEYSIINKCPTEDILINNSNIQLNSEGTIYLKNDSEIRRKIHINLNKYFEKSNIICFSVSLSDKSENAYTYFYLSSTQGKMRYDKSYLLNFQDSKDMIFSIYLSPMSWISFNIEVLSLNKIL